MVGRRLPNDEQATYHDTDYLLRIKPLALETATYFESMLYKLDAN
jgi:hypothetical protein